MIFGHQCGIKCLKEHRDGSNNMRGLEGNIQIFCDVDTKGLRGYPERT